MTRMEQVMKEVREQRDNLLSNKKLKEIELLQTGKLNTFGFAGSQLMGMGNTASSAAYNTQQVGGGGSFMAGQSTQQMSANRFNQSQSISDYGYGGAQGYNADQSYYSNIPRQAKTRAVIEKAKAYCRNQQIKAQRAEKAMLMKQSSKDRRNPQKRAQDEEKKLEMEVIEAYNERQAKLQRIGSFRFDIDNDLDVEILVKEQVFEDLDDIKNIREKTGGDENNQLGKSLMMAMYTRGGKKKKKR